MSVFGSTALLSQMQLAWIESFLAVVDFGGFGAAGQSLYRSQSRISAHIADLESRLGATLFDRSARPVALTEAGQAFLPHARACVEALVEGEDAVAGVKGLLRGRIALGTYPSAGAAVLPGVLRRFTDEHPGVEVELVEAAVHGLDDALASGRVALAIRPEFPEPAPDIAGRLLWSEPMKVVVPVGHPFTEEAGPLPLARLADVPLIVTGTYLHHDAEAFELFGAAGLTPRISYVSNQPQNLVGLVAAGLGIGLTNLLALSTIRLDGVAVLAVDTAMGRRAGIYWNARRPVAPAARVLGQLFVDAALPQGTERIVEDTAVHSEESQMSWLA